MDSSLIADQGSVRTRDQPIQMPLATMEGPNARSVLLAKLLNDKLWAKPRFDWADPSLEVEWTPHPTWRETWSKRSLMYLDHPSVPRAMLHSDIDLDTLDYANVIAKPMDAYSGKGFIGEVTRAKLEEIPASERHNWCVQERTPVPTTSPISRSQPRSRACRGVS
jgi:hypothetical protein